MLRPTQLRCSARPTHVQAQGIGGRPIKYRGMMDVLRKTVQNEGVRGLYKVCLGI